MKYISITGKKRETKIEPMLYEIYAIELRVNDAKKKRKKNYAHLFANYSFQRRDSAFSARRKIKLLSDIVYRYLNRPTATSTDSLISARPPSTTSPAR